MIFLPRDSQPKYTRVVSVVYEHMSYDLNSLLGVI